MAKKKYYAVRKGRAPDIYTSWPETEDQVKGYPGAQYKGFASKSEAESWLRGEVSSAGISPGKKKKIPEKFPELEITDILIYTDGGAIGNPGPGGYGAIVVSDTGEKVLSGGFRLTTNNRMELTACIVALREVRGSRKKIDLFSDSSYVVNGIAKGWAKKWRLNGWVKSDKKPVMNPDLWAELLQLCEKLDVHFHWVRGHAGNTYNERCDQLAVASARGKNLGEDREYECSVEMK